jgi:hypothetical protein
MTNISITLYTNKFFGAVLKSPIQRGSLSVNNSVTNISRLGTFNLLPESTLSPSQGLWIWPLDSHPRANSVMWAIPACTADHSRRGDTEYAYNPPPPPKTTTCPP